MSMVPLERHGAASVAGGRVAALVTATVDGLFCQTLLTA
jgi:hypothetical protein